MPKTSCKSGIPGKHRTKWQPFSIVIPAHNEENYLSKTLKAIDQSFAEIDCRGEVIVVNDASTDQTVSVALDHSARVINVDLRNIGAVRNAGAKTCRAPWLFFLDADTILPSRTLAAALDQLAMGAAGGGAAVEIDPATQISVFKWGIFYAMKIAWQSIGGWAAGCFILRLKSTFSAAQSAKMVGSLSLESRSLLRRESWRHIQRLNCSDL
jgi:glycosyltransferase involved in cell wall biosynthesis